MVTECSMETDTDTLLKFDVPCPACGGPAHVVADPDADRARWCCTTCLTIGAAPFSLPEGREAIPRRPVATA